MVRMSAAPQSTLQPVVAAWACGRCGADLDAACDALTMRGSCGGIGPELIIHRLEQAGATLMAMRTKSPYPTGYRSGMPEVLREAIEAYGWSEAEVRPAVPSSAAIDAMDRTFGWLNLIPNHRHVLRRIVAARLLVSPITGKHLAQWKALAVTVRADYRAVQRWHSQGVAIIVAAL